MQAYFESRAAGVDMPGRMSARARHKDGSWVTLEGTVSPMRRRRRRAAQFVCVARTVHRPALRAAAS